MNKKNWELAKKLVVFCDMFEPKLDYMKTLDQLASGLAEFDGIGITWREPKLTKPEQLLADMREVAHNAVSDIMLRDDFKQLKVDTIVKMVCVKHFELALDKPQVFKRIIREVIQEATAPIGVVLEEGKIQMKESEINPAMREWAVKNGIEITPLPDQTM